MRTPVGLLAMSFALAVSSCGGGDTNVPTIQIVEPEVAALLRMQADAAEARALSLAPTAVCTADKECGMLSFADAFPSCNQHRDFPILLTAPTRFQAESAAASQRALAFEAVAAYPNQFLFGCLAFIQPYPIPYCEQKQCKLKPSLYGLGTPPGQQ